MMNEMCKVITDVEIGWSNRTFVFYLAIVFTSYFLTFLFQNTNISLNHKKSINLGLVLSFLLLGFIRCFGTTGIDLRNGYLHNFSTATSLNNYYDKTVEIGFRVLMVIIKNIFDNYEVFIFVTSALTLLPVFYVLNKRKNSINLPLTVLFYASVFYFPGFSAMRNLLASSIVLLAFDKMLDGDPVYSLVFLIISVLFHKSSLFYLPIYFLTFFKSINKSLIFYLLAVVFLLVLFAKDYISILLSFSDRYNIYSSFEDVNIGMQMFIYYLPLIFLLYLQKISHKANKENRLLFVTLLYGFVLGLTGYIISILGRIQDTYIVLILVVGIITKRINKNVKYSSFINILIVLYCLLRFTVFMNDYTVGQWLMPYTNMFGIIIK